MQFLPIARRELRVASRRPRTYRVRVWAALLTLACAAYAGWIFSRASGASGSGRSVLTMVVRLAFMYCLFAGVGNTADCLSSEKREGTLGLLFLTPLRGYDIVVG